MNKDKVPYYKMVVDEIKQKIVSGEYREGERLPGAVKLARLYNISPVTANKALEVLEASGHVLRNSRKGTFVREKKVPRLSRILVPITHVWQEDSPQLLSYLSGIIQEASARNVEVKLEPFDSSCFDSAESVKELECQAVLQLGAADITFPYQALRKSGLPWLVVGISEKSEQKVIAENRDKAASDLVSTMLGNGCRRIGFIGNLARPNHRACRDGYVGAAKDSGVGATLIRDAEEDSLEAAIKELITQGEIDGLVICGSMLLKGLSILRRLQLTFPLGGFRESVAMAVLEGELYLAALNQYETGRKAVECLDYAIAGSRELDDILIDVDILLPKN